MLTASLNNPPQIQIGELSSPSNDHPLLLDLSVPSPEVPLVHAWGSTSCPPASTSRNIFTFQVNSLSPEVMEMKKTRDVPPTLPLGIMMARNDELGSRHRFLKAGGVRALMNNQVKSCSTQLYCFRIFVSVQLGEVKPVPF